MITGYSVVWCFWILISNEQVAGQKSGPYKIIVNRMSDCEAEGTGQIKIGTRISSKGNNIYTYTNNVTFQVPLDDKTKLQIEVQQFKNGAYVPRFITQTLKNCEKIMKVMRPILTEMFKAANYTVTGCPIPTGTYEVHDWNLHIEFSNMPTMFYSSYKMINTFYRNGAKVGCVVIYGDAVPNES